MSTDTDWDLFCARRSRLQLPLRPDAAIAARLAEILAGQDARVLMLGLTPELSGVGEQLTVAEWNRQMLEIAWPPDRPRSGAVLTDWREMEFAAGSFTAAAGDGSLNVVSATHHRRIFERLAMCLAPGGRIAIRCFVAPDTPESLAAIAAEVMAGEEPSFHALKWRIAMSLAPHSGGDVAVANILAAFDEHFADREELSVRTGWSLETISEIDSYRTSGAVYSFVTRVEFLAALPPGFVRPRFEPSGDYPLSERCPFLVAEVTTSLN